jgi:hypothetical protein
MLFLILHYNILFLYRIFSNKKLIDLKCSNIDYMVPDQAIIHRADGYYNLRTMNQLNK